MRGIQIGAVQCAVRSAAGTENLSACRSLSDSTNVSDDDPDDDLSGRRSRVQSPLCVFSAPFANALRSPVRFASGVGGYSEWPDAASSIRESPVIGL